jgi:hypothetical protein
LCTQSPSTPHLSGSPGGWTRARPRKTEVLLRLASVLLGNFLRGHDERRHAQDLDKPRASGGRDVEAVVQRAVAGVEDAVVAEAAAARRGVQRAAHLTCRASCSLPKKGAPRRSAPSLRPESPGGVVYNAETEQPTTAPRDHLLLCRHRHRHHRLFRPRPALSRRGSCTSSSNLGLSVCRRRRRASPFCVSCLSHAVYIVMMDLA